MNNEFDNLWERFLSDQLSEEEVKEFRRLLATEDPQIPEAIHQMLLDKEIKGLAPAGREQFLLERILSETSRSQEAPVRKIYRLKWVAAALLFLAAGAAWYGIAHQRRDLSTAAPRSAARQDIAPGHNGAILTLSNGKEIILDSAGNGQVASDGQVKVLKKEGEISYEGKAAEIVYNNVSTPRGRQWQLTLSDGTKVWLNAESSIRYPVNFTGNERVVEITGEAYFEVTRNETNPFIVKTPEQEVKVLGTHFDVNAYGDEPVFRTTLLEGSVKVTTGGHSAVIRPGEQAINNYTAGELKVQKTDVNDVLAWINGRFKFDHSDIRTVMRQLARWYDVEVEYQGHLPDYEFAGGTFRSNNLSEVLHVLELSGVHFKMEGRKIIVMQ